MEFKLYKKQDLINTLSNKRGNACDINNIHCSEDCALYGALSCVSVTLAKQVKNVRQPHHFKTVKSAKKLIQQLLAD